MKFAFFHLVVQDLEGMAAWYRDVVGMKQYDDSNDYKGFMTEDGFSFAMLRRGQNADEPYPQGLNGTMNLGFNVPTFKDVDAAYNRLIEAGGKGITSPVTAPWGHRIAYAADPEGNILCINAEVE